MTRVFAKVRGAAIALVSTAAALTPASAAAGAAHLDGASLGPLWAVPFVGLLLSIAIMPLATPHFWHKNYGKVSLAWAIAFLVPFTALYGFDLGALRADAARAGITPELVAQPLDEIPADSTCITFQRARA